MTNIFYFCAFALVLIATGCTRPSLSKSQITLTLPKNQIIKGRAKTKGTLGALTATVANPTVGQLFHLVVNVRNADGSLAYEKSLDAKSSGNNGTPLAETITIDLPTGNNRLIQIIAVYADQATKLGSFFYGDQVVNFMSGTQDITLPITELATGNIEGGRIQGRFFGSNGETPTAILEIKYQPPNGKPPMTIEKDPMLDGWFSAFALESINLDWWISGRSTPVLTGVTLNSLNPTDNKFAKIYLPNRVHKYSGGSQETQNAETIIVGFFGPGVPTTYKACLNNGSHVFTNLFQTDGLTPLLVVNANDNINLAIEGHNSFGACSNTDASLYFSSVMPIDPAILDSWGGSEGLTGHSDIFLFPTDISMGSSPANASVNLTTNKLTVSYSILPNLQNSVDSVAIFMRASNSPKDYESKRDGLCQALVNGEFGFRKLTQIATTVGVNSYVKNDIVRPVDLSTSSALAFCPMKNNVPVSNGFVNSWINLDPGTATGGGTPTQLEISRNGNPKNLIGNYACFDADIRLKDASNSMTSSTAPFAVTLDVKKDGVSQNAALIYLTGSDCSANTNAISSTVTFPSNQNSLRVYFKTTDEPNSVVWSYSASASSLTSSAFSLTSLTSSSYFTKLEMPYSLVPSICYPARITYMNGNDYATTVNSDLTVNLTTPDSNLQFYSTSNCSTSISSAIIAASTSFTDIYVKASLPANTTSTSRSVTVGFSGGPITSQYETYIKSGSTTPSKLIMFGATQVQRGYCNGPYELRFANENQTEIPTNSNLNLSVTSDLGVQIYPDNICSSGSELTGNTLTVPTGTLKKMIWANFKLAKAGSLILSGSGLTSVTNSISVGGLNSFYFNTSALSSTVPHGTCVELPISARERNNVTGALTDLSYLPSNNGNPFKLELMSFPANSLYYGQINGECVRPFTGTSLKIPEYNTNPVKVYYLVTNNSNSVANVSTHQIHIQGSDFVTGTNLSFPVNPPASLALNAGPSEDVAVEVPFDITSIIQRFTGIPNFITEFNNTTWQADSDGLVSVPPTTALNIRVTDQAGTQISSMVTGRAATGVFDFTSGSLPTEFSMVRSTEAYTVNADGYLAWIHAGTPRVWHDPSPLVARPSAALGVLVEGSMTNLVGAGVSASEDFSLWDINPDGNGSAQVSRDNTGSTLLPTVPTGTTEYAWRFSDTNGGNGSNVEHAIYTWGTSANASKSFVGSVFLRKDTSRYVGIMLQDNGSSSGAVIDLDTGETSSMTGPYTPQTNLGYGVEKYRNGWYRLWVRFNSSTSMTSGLFYIFPAFCGSSRPNLCTSGEYGATGGVFVWGAQIEEGTQLTSYYPSYNSGGYRGQDDLTMALTSLASFNPAQGTFRLETGPLQNPGLDKRLLVLDGSSGQIELQSTYSDRIMVNVYSTTANATQIQAASLVPMSETGPNSLAFSYRRTANDWLSYIGINGITSFNMTGNTTIVAPSRLQIGGKMGTNASYSNLVVKKLYYWNLPFGAPGVGSASK